MSRRWPTRGSLAGTQSTLSSPPCSSRIRYMPMARQRIPHLTGRYSAMSRQRAMTLVTLALLNVFTIAAGATTADLLRAREALLAAPRVAARPLVRAGSVLAPGGPAGPLPTRAGLSAALSRLLSLPALGPDVGAVVTDPATGQVLFSRAGTSLLT